MTPYSDVVGYPSFGGLYCLHLQGIRIIFETKDPLEVCQDTLNEG